MEELSNFVFLFDADYPPFERLYGYECNNCFSSALSSLELNSEDAVTIKIGDLLLDNVSRKLTGAEKKGNLIASSYDLNKYLYASVLLDLAETLSLDWSTININDFFRKGIQFHNFYCISVSNINSKMACKLDNLMMDQPFYVGAAQLDFGNPLHLILFVEDLIPVFFIKNNTIFSHEDYDDFEWDYFHETYQITLIDSLDFNDKLPSISIPTSLSDRGKNTINIFKNKGHFGHHKKVGETFLQALRNQDITKDFKLDTAINIESEVRIPKEKLAGYALNLEHSHGKSKAKFFKDVLNIEATDWKYLSEQIKLGLNHGEVHDIRVDKYGIQYHVDIVVTGLNSASSTIRTAWIIRANEPIQLVTVHPISKTGKEEELVFNRPVMAITSDIHGDERWGKIFDLAEQAGINASRQCIPTPVLISQTSQIIKEGKLGKVLISFSDKKNEFVQWLEKTNKGYMYEGIYTLVIVDDTQSLERAIAYANEFSMVLRANQIECTISPYA